jgi:hypothetical protein
MNRFPSATATNARSPLRPLPAEDYSPRRLALNFAPKMVVIEFLRPSTGKLYQKRIKLSPNVIQKTPETILKALRNRYPLHFGPKIKDDQLLRLLQRLLVSDASLPRNTSQVSGRTKSPREKSSHKKNKSNEKENVFLCKGEAPFKLKSGLYEQVISNDSLFAKKENRANQQTGDTTPARPSQLVTSKQSSHKKRARNESTPVKSEDSIPEDFVEDFDDCFDEIEDEEVATPAKKPKGKELSESKSILLSELKGVDIHRDDLNKVTLRDIAKAKKKMDEQFLQNQLNQDDSGFQYDKRAEFKANESNEWDEEVLDDF